MKWDISREDNIMDYIIEDANEFDLENVERKDITNNDTIKKMVFKKADLTKRCKKHIKKKTMFALISAAAVLVLGMVTVGASGSFDSAFGEFFAGEAVDGLYGKGDASVNIKGDLKAEFMGVTGDNTSAYASISLKKADGSSFADKDKDVVILLGEDISVDKNGKETMIDCFDYDIKMKNPIFDFSQHSFSSGYDCSLSSDDTINLLFTISSSDVDPKGKEFEVSAGPELYLYQIDKRLCEAEYGEAESDKLYAQMKKYVPELKDGQVVLRYYDEALNKWFLVIADKTVYNFELSANVKMNYRTDYKEFKITKEFDVNSKKNLQLDKVTAGAFAVNIKGRIGSISQREIINIRNNFEKNPIYLIMNDGSKIKCESYSSSCSFSSIKEGKNGTAEFDWIFDYSLIENKRKIIDVNNIESITIGDIKFDIK